VKPLALLAALFVVELLIASTFLDGAALAGRPGLAGQVGSWGAWILRAIVGFAGAFVAFAGVQGNLQLPTLLAEASSSRVRWLWLALHAAFAVAFSFLSAALYGDGNVAHPDVLALAWILSGLLAILTACVAFLSSAFWVSLRKRTGHVWLYAAIVSVAAVSLVRASQSLWQFTAQLTFQLVQTLLLPIFPDLGIQPERLRLSTPRFGVIVDQACSGLEGAGLMLVFVTVWLLLSRRDFRFPRSLLLIPAGILTLYLLNAVRIAVLFVIGNAGAPAIAAGGFHSQAGWIAFNGVAFAMTVFVPRLRWFRLHPEPPRPLAATDNPTATFLLPFLAILAAGMVARAASADFEWLYPLRFLAAAGTLWALRSELRNLDWRSGWLGPLAGFAVFLVWVGLDRWNGIEAGSMPPALAAAAPASRGLWMTLRFLAAVTTVPIAEELAFRGFLMRRWTTSAFEQVSLRQASWLGVVFSSLAFGFLHGDRWIAGVLAGLLFAWVARRSNRIGDCVVAHAVANLLLGTLVLGRGRWELW